MVSLCRSKPTLFRERFSKKLSYEAFLETLSIATEARTAAMLEAQIPSSVSGLPSSGTGTDCIVMAAPLFSNESPLRYAGKHTVLGSLVGQSVFESVSAAISRCKLTREFVS